MTKICNANINFDYSKAVSPDVSLKNNLNLISYSENTESLNFDLLSDDNTRTNMDGSVILDGKYVDENGKSFDAEYYYSPDGTYNVSYTDGNKFVDIKFQTDGSKMYSEVSYKDPLTNADVKEVTWFYPNGREELSKYVNNNLSSKQVTDKNGTTTYTEYNGEKIKYEKVTKPDGSYTENIWDKKSEYVAQTVSCSSDGSKIISDFSFLGNKVSDKYENANGIVTEERRYFGGNIMSITYNDEFGNMKEERIFRENGKVRNINFPDGRVYDYDENGNLSVAHVSDDLTIRFNNGKVTDVFGEGNDSPEVSVYYGEDGSMVYAKLDENSAAEANIGFSIEKNVFASDELKDREGTPHISGTLSEIHFGKNAQGYDSNMIVTLDGEKYHTNSAFDDVKIDLSALNDYLSIYQKYGDGYLSVN